MRIWPTFKQDGGGGCFYDLRTNLPETSQYKITEYNVDARFADDLERVELTHDYTIVWAEDVERQFEQFFIPYSMEELDPTPTAINSDHPLQVLPSPDGPTRTKLEVRYRNSTKKRDDEDKMTITWGAPTHKEGLLSETLLSRRLFFHIWAINSSAIDVLRFRMHPPKGGRIARTNPPLNLRTDPVSMEVKGLRPVEVFGLLVEVVRPRLDRHRALLASVSSGSIVVGGLISILSLSVLPLAIAIVGVFAVVTLVLLYQAAAQ